MTIQTEYDGEFFARELNGFVPSRIFDAHAHLYRASFFSGEIPGHIAQFPEMGFADFTEAMGEILPGRRVSGLFFGWPDAAIDVAANNRFVSQQARLDPNSRAAMLITPAMDPEFLRECVRQQGFTGFKCYHVYSSRKPTFDALIPEYLTEEQVRIAHEEGLSITLHIVRARALADPDNRETIRAWARKYSNARFILAHAARGFNPHHTLAGIESLRGLGNVWCDTSAITDSGAFEAVIRSLGAGRLLYGGDSPVMNIHGRSVAIGDSFLWVTEANTVFETEYGRVHPVLVGLESLRTLKLACWNLRLSDSDVEKIFWSNAADLFSLK